MTCIVVSDSRYYFLIPYFRKGYTWTWEFWICCAVLPLFCFLVLFVCFAICIRRMRSRRASYVVLADDEYTPIVHTVYVNQVAPAPPTSPPPPGIQPVPVYSTPAYGNQQYT